jgi:hypothetical protein
VPLNPTTVPLPIATELAFQFNTDVVGGVPSGHAIRFPFEFIAVTVNWNETA